MKRRKFISFSIAGAATCCLPMWQCGIAESADRPDFLHSLVGPAKLNEIGKAYVERHPEEADHENLVKLISGTFSKNPNTPLNVTIQNEFRNGNIVAVNGWILSLTEARQSALFYLNSR